MLRSMTLAAALMMPVAAYAAPNTMAAGYVAKAGAADKFEIQSSEMVMNSKNPKVRDFAAKMVQDHTKSTNMVKAAAMKSGMMPKPPMLDAQQSAMIAELRKLNGPARDAAYIADQKKAHQMALNLHQTYASTGTDPNLKMAASNIVPVVQGHIQMLQSM